MKKHSLAVLFAGVLTAAMLGGCTYSTEEAKAPVSSAAIEETALEETEAAAEEENAEAAAEEETSAEAAVAVEEETEAEPGLATGDELEAEAEEETEVEAEAETEAAAETEAEAAAEAEAESAALAEAETETEAEVEAGAEAAAEAEAETEAQAEMEAAAEAEAVAVEAVEAAETEQASPTWYVNAIRNPVNREKYSYYTLMDIDGDGIDELFLSTTEDFFIGAEDRAALIRWDQGREKQLMEIGGQGGEGWYFDAEEMMLSYYSRLSGERHLKIYKMDNGSMKQCGPADIYQPYHEPLTGNNSETVYLLNGIDAKKEEVEDFWQQFANEIDAVTYHEPLQ